MRHWRGTVFLSLVFSLLILPVKAQQSASDRFTILLSNDDGYDAPGLRALTEALRPIGQIIVAAPTFEQSGKGHGLTLREPIAVSERKQPNGTTWYSIEGPPATCVRLALESLLTRRPDLVISGINRGDNLGITVYHSGTVGAAREAAIVGLPAIAVSIRGDDATTYAAAASFVRNLVEELRAKNALKPGLFLNVNVPVGPTQGARLTGLSVKPRYDRFERQMSPMGRLFFWPAFEQLEDDAEGTDVWAFVRGFITVTPMKLDVVEGEADQGLRSLALWSLATTTVR
jgi:5'-nucleotidase